jgi:hypothetical protein
VLNNVISTDISRRLDIVARRGDTFILHLEVLDSELNPYNLINYKVKMSIVQSLGAKPLCTLSGNDTCLVGALNHISNGDGFISIEVPSSVTKKWKDGEYLYDLSLTAISLCGDGDKTTWLTGKFIINPDITL